MPYIKQEYRDKYTEVIDGLVAKVDNSSARLSHLLFALTVMLVEEQKYYQYERAMGFLSCLSQEFSRRVPLSSPDLRQTKLLFEEFDHTKETLAIVKVLLPEDRGTWGGHLNFIMSSLFNKLVVDLKFEKDQISTILHLFTSAYYDKIVGPYEDEKIEENGDVYDSDLTTLF